MSVALPPLPNWKPLAGRVLEAALGRALALDQDTRTALRDIDGRSVVLELAAPPLALRIAVADGRLRVGPARDRAEPDLAVRATLGGLLAQLPFLRAAAAPPVGKLRIEGDAELARRLQRLAAGFDPDWQRPFARVFGDVLGVQVANAIAAALRQAGALAVAGAENLADYLSEDSRDLVAKAELAAFCDDVDRLRDDAERLAARVARLRGAG